MFQFRACPRELEPEVAASQKDKRMQQHQIWEILSEPVKPVFIAHSIDIVVLVAIEVILDSLRLKGQGHRKCGIEILSTGLVNYPLAGQADHLVLRDLKRAPEYCDHQHYHR